MADRRGPTDERIGSHRVEISDHQFPRRHRLRHRVEFAVVYRQRRPVSDETLLVFARHNQLGHPRLGLSVSRKVGKAVVRNRWKRLIREAFRQSKSELPASLDLIVIPRSKELPSLAVVKTSLTRLAKQIDKRLAQDH
jgi:ribonuclease P protein component